MPYIIVFLASTGLDIKEAGFITGIRLVSSAICAPFWGYIADHTGKRKLIFFILCIGTAVTIFPMPWVSNACISSGPVISQNLSVNITHAHWNNKGYEQPLFSGKLFYVMLTMVFISNIFSNPINGVVDSFVMNVVKSHPREADYGKQRVYGALGFGISNFLAGFLSDHYHENSLSKYTAIFYVFLPSILLLIPCGLTLASQTNIEIVNEQQRTKRELLIKTFRNFDNILFMLSTFFVGVANAVVIGYIFMLMEDEMHASRTIMGLANLVASLIEIFVFPFSSKILSLCGGAVGGIEVAIFSYFVRFIILSYIRNPWLVLPTQLFNCLSFALFWTAAVEYTQEIAPKEIHVTMFSMLNSVYFNVAGLVGYLGGGVIYSTYGGRMLFQASAYLSGIWCLVLLFYYQLIGRVRRHLSIQRQTETTSTNTLDTVA